MPVTNEAHEDNPLAVLWPRVAQRFRRGLRRWGVADENDLDDMTQDVLASLVDWYRIKGPSGFPTTERGLLQLADLFAWRKVRDERRKRARRRRVVVGSVEQLAGRGALGEPEDPAASSAFDSIVTAVGVGGQLRRMALPDEDREAAALLSRERPARYTEREKWLLRRSRIRARLRDALSDMGGLGCLAPAGRRLAPLARRLRPRLPRRLLRVRTAFVGSLVGGFCAAVVVVPAISGHDQAIAVDSSAPPVLYGRRVVDRHAAGAAGFLNPSAAVDHRRPAEQSAVTAATPRTPPVRATVGLRHLDNAEAADATVEVTLLEGNQNQNHVVLSCGTPVRQRACAAVRALPPMMP
jgi:hypothetical protein